MFRPAVFIAIALCACASSQPVAETSTIATAPNVTIPDELATQAPGLLRAWQGQDAAAVLAYYADNAVVVSPEGRFTGSAEIQSKWIAPALPMISSFVASPTTFTREGNDIIESGRYSHMMTMDGKTSKVSGGYSH
ncbi:MAG TPA: nuclear transport factor 2 family protein, partial [Longimicrobiales bacterium]